MQHLDWAETVLYDRGDFLLPQSVTTMAPVLGRCLDWTRDNGQDGLWGRPRGVHRADRPLWAPNGVD